MRKEFINFSLIKRLNRCLQVFGRGKWLGKDVVRRRRRAAGNRKSG